MKRDTIAALATPNGRGGIGVVRISGELTTTIMREILRKTLTPREATYSPFFAADDEMIDEGIAIYFPNPHSFTGEDVLELQGHGGQVVMDMLLQRILALGARLANPGEFSERAFLNGKLDLAQAESIADLIDASSRQAARSAMQSLQGKFSREINLLNEKIIHLRMYVEASIDFSDEEINFLADEKISLMLQDILQTLTTIQQQAQQGSFLREGITAVIVGKPNVGKSSLLNCLAGKEVAIVTDIPGTTRDVLRDYILIDGIPLHVVDTAGLRDSDDKVEQEGIRRAQQEMQKADVVLVMMDADESEFKFGKEQKVIYIRNKIDLLQLLPRVDRYAEKNRVYLSAMTGAGIDLLKQQIKQEIGYQTSAEGVFLARRRHLDALDRAHHHVQIAKQQLQESASGELAAEDLRLAHLALCEITGEFTADDLLGKIFGSFCIGK